jgi:hypothetical protein
MGTDGVVNCLISYNFGMSVHLLRRNETVDMSSLYTYNILIVKKNN